MTEQNGLRARKGMKERKTKQTQRKKQGDKTNFKHSLERESRLRGECKNTPHIEGHPQRV